MGSGLAVDGRGIATYTIDEAATRNALSTRLLEDIEHALTVLKQDHGVRVVVFTGAGEVFSSGADRAELGEPSTIEKATQLLSSVLTLIDESAVPVVCRVNGAAFGAGLAIVAAADIGIAVGEAFFGLPEVRFGLVAGPAAAACLGRMGQPAALDVLLTGRRFTAIEAQQMQLVARVVEREQLDAALEALLAELLLGDTAAISTTRRVVRQLASPTLAERLRAFHATGEVTETENAGHSR
jgi:methylglutaconyl-CoA hydratase